MPMSSESVSPYTEWCIINKCTHGHCPFSCEHPQPMVTDDDRCVCALCLHYSGELVDVAPCTPENCPDKFERA